MEVAQRIFQRQFITVRAQPGHHPDREVGKIRVVAEGFARVDVGKMDFDERNGSRRQRIAQGNAGVGVARRIDDDEVDLVVCGLVDAVDQGAFVVVLKGLDRGASGFPAADQRTVDVVKRGVAVVPGFAAASRLRLGPCKTSTCGCRLGTDLAAARLVRLVVMAASLP